MPFGVSTQAGVDRDPRSWKEFRGHMAMLADVVDAVIGGDTHRDTHTLEMTTPAGATITTITVGNDEPGSSRRWRGSPNMPPVPAWWWGWKAPAATGSGWPGPRPRPG